VTFPWKKSFPRPCRWLSTRIRFVKLDLRQKILLQSHNTWSDGSDHQLLSQTYEEIIELCALNAVLQV